MEKTEDLIQLLAQMKSAVSDLEEKIANSDSKAGMKRTVRPKKTRAELDELRRKRDAEREERAKRWALVSAARLNKERFRDFMAKPEWLNHLNDESTDHVRAIMWEWIEGEKDWHHGYEDQKLKAIIKISRAAIKGADSEEYESAVDELASITNGEDSKRNDRYWAVFMFYLTIRGYNRLLGDFSEVSRLN